MKYALIIGNDRYRDPKLAQLKTPTADSQALARVLKDQNVGSFDEVIQIVNNTKDEISRAIGAFLSNKRLDDLVLLYFSGHGVLDDRGRLFLAAQDTLTDNILRATAIPSSFVVDELDNCRSKRQILILDCCHSGAFGRGVKGVERKAVTETTFEGSGFGRVVLTASDSTQYALEGDRVIKQTELSLFTHFLLEGLQTGKADINNDGYVSLDEWYDYTYIQVLSTTPTQVPHKWSYHQQGDLIIARNPSWQKKAVDLPAKLLDLLESPYSSVREVAVKELSVLLRSRDSELAELARQTLEKLKDDDSRTVSLAVENILLEAGLAKEIREKAEHETAEKAAREKEKRDAAEKAAQEREEFLGRIRNSLISRIRFLEEGIKSIAARFRTLLEKILGYIQKRFSLIFFILASIVVLMAIQTILPLSLSGIFNLISPTTTFTPTPTLIITPSITATKAQTSTPLVLTPTITPSPTITYTPTPFPESSLDIKNVEMILIPEGPFLMGYDKGTAAEDPQGKRTLDAFYIDKYEVTNKSYAECVEARSCEPPHKNNSNTHNNYYGNPKYDNYPVINIDWYMAATYCTWRDARLPIEPEWEKAARGTDGRLFPWGDKESCEYTNANKCVGDTTTVGSYESGKSIFGSYDMAGNVKEWVSSLFVEYPYRTNDGRENMNAEGARVLRGGAWNTFADFRTSYRSGIQPSFYSTSIGFRCSRSIPEIEIPGSILGIVNTDIVVNCRLQPGLNGRIIDFLQPSSSVTIFSRLSDSSWLSVKVPGIESCWVSAELITITSGSIRDIPVSTVTP